MTEDTPAEKAVWHTIHGDHIRWLLQRAYEGEDPDLLYIELYASGRRDRVEDE